MQSTLTLSWIDQQKRSLPRYLFRPISPSSNHAQVLRLNKNSTDESACVRTPTVPDRGFFPGLFLSLKSYVSRVRASTTLASWMAKWRPGQACGPYPKTRWSGPVVTALEYMLINEKGGGGWEWDSWSGVVTWNLFSLPGRARSRSNLGPSQSGGY